MKGFIITTCIFGGLLICIFLNFNYVNTAHSTMHEIVDELSDKPCQENNIIISKLQEYWDSQNTILSISVSFREIDDLSDAIDALSAANKIGDTSQFSIYKQLVENAIDSVIRLEKFSIKNIL